MFKFDFTAKENEKPELKQLDKIEWLKTEEIEPNLQLSETLIKADDTYGEIQVDDICIKYVSTFAILNYLISGNTDEDNEDVILLAEQNHSDLLTAKYEGGLKVWEGTQDLLHYLINEKVDFEKKVVLDLGCGAGILGINAMQKSALEVDFQDYNSTVIKYCTITNILLNGFKLDDGPKCRFYSGDWESFSELAEQHCKYDVILTSETIYNENNYSKLHAVFKNCLQTNGTIFLAAKTCYFGLNGSIKTFKDFINSENTFNWKVVWIFSDGVKREIIKLTRKRNQ